MNTNTWAQIAKKALSDKDRKETISIEVKTKVDIAEKKKKEYEAYLERKARREERAKQQEEYDDKRYALFNEHMWYIYGASWSHIFHEYSDRAHDIPYRLFDRVQDEIEQQECIHDIYEGMGVNTWLDQQACNNDKREFYARIRKEKGKIWIEGKIKEGKIKEIGEGRFEYYP